MMMFTDQTELLPSWTLMLMAANSLTRWRKMKGTSNSWMVEPQGILELAQNGWASQGFCLLLAQMNLSWNGFL